jgi:hypothetical protein
MTCAADYRDGGGIVKGRMAASGRRSSGAWSHVAGRWISAWHQERVRVTKLAPGRPASPAKNGVNSMKTARTARACRNPFTFTRTGSQRRTRTRKAGRRANPARFPRSAFSPHKGCLCHFPGSGIQRGVASSHGFSVNIRKSEPSGRMTAISPYDCGLCG